MVRSVVLMGLALVLTACTSGDRQEEESAPPGAPATPAAAPVPAEAGIGGIAEVIVTASRVSGAALQNRRYTTLRQSAVGPQDSAERYPEINENRFQSTREAPVSTFSVDVDSASYANVRRLLRAGTPPPADAVRVEELINYFEYTYPAPEDGAHPFAVTVEPGPSPWGRDRHLLHVGIAGRAPANAPLPPSNLVFLVDTSGSMRPFEKLGYIKSSLRMLARRMRAEDRLSLAVYAGSAGVVLEPTAGNRALEIEQAIDRLEAGGSTNGGAGIELAYAMARQGFIEGGINRVLLATDGDFNVGVTDLRTLEALIVRERESGIALTVLGFGQGNYNDAVMQTLAQKGNGNAAYIDSMSEARKVLIDEMGATLNTIATDVKVQVEFNPAVVSDYRLIGYETRHLEREDFNNDKIDAGEIGAGHTVTALYELVLHGSSNPVNDALRYAPAPPAAGSAGEIAHIKLRYKPDVGTESRLLTLSVKTAALSRHTAATSENFRFAAAVAGFGQLLRGGRYLGDFDYNDVVALASDARGRDENGYRGEFLGLVRTAEAIMPPPQAAPATDDEVETIGQAGARREIP